MWQKLCDQALSDLSCIQSTHHCRGKERYDRAKTRDGVFISSMDLKAWSGYLLSKDAQAKVKILSEIIHVLVGFTHTHLHTNTQTCICTDTVTRFLQDKIV